MSLAIFALGSVLVVVAGLWACDASQANPKILGAMLLTILGTGLVLIGAGAF